MHSHAFPNIRYIRESIGKGEVGQLEMLLITSRDLETRGMDYL